MSSQAYRWPGATVSCPGAAVGNCHHATLTLVMLLLWHLLWLNLGSLAQFCKVWLNPVLSASLGGTVYPNNVLRELVDLAQLPVSQEPSDEDPHLQFDAPLARQ